MDREALRVLFAQGESVERIAERFGRHPSTVSYWMNRHGLEAVQRERHAARGGLDRERLAGLVDAGLTIAEVAAEVTRSKATVRYWLKRYQLRTRNTVGRRPSGVRTATVSAAVEIRQCVVHGSTEFVRDRSGRHRCRRCRGEAVSRRRRRVKLILIGEAGGCCIACGYDRHPAALVFHHLDPSQKRMVISARGVGLSLDTLRAEARKCVLLCANCHAEVERGALRLPVNSPGSEHIAAMRPDPG